MNSVDLLCRSMIGQKMYKLVITQAGGGVKHGASAKNILILCTAFPLPLLLLCFPFSAGD